MSGIIYLDGEEHYPFDSSTLTCNDRIAIHGPGSITWTESEDGGDLKTAEFHNGATLSKLVPHHTLSDMKVTGTACQIEATLSSVVNAYRNLIQEYPDEIRAPFNVLHIALNDNSRCTVVHHDFDGQCENEMVRLPHLNNGELWALVVSHGIIEPSTYAYLYSIGTGKFVTNVEDIPW